MQKCEFEFCIYQKNGNCMLSSISINSLGMCNCAIVISITEIQLDNLKEQSLKRLEINH